MSRHLSCKHIQPMVRPNGMINAYPQTASGGSSSGSCRELTGDSGQTLERPLLSISGQPDYRMSCREGDTTDAELEELSDLQKFDVFISYDDALKSEKVIDEIICQLRPKWPKKQTVSERMQGGWLNLMMCYHLSDDEDKEDAIMVRINNKKLSEQGYFRENEFLAMQVANKAGIYTGIIGVFLNGMIYKYLQGRSLKTAGPELSQEKYIRMICRSQAKLHLTKPGQCQLIDMNGQLTEYPEDRTIIKLLCDMLTEGPNAASIKSGISFRATGVSPEELTAELKWLEDQTSHLGLSRCFAHNDILPSNIILDEEKDCIKIIDYEFAAYGYETSALYGLCDGHDLFVIYGMLPADAPRPTDAMLRLWQRIYLEEKYKLQGRDISEITDATLELFYAEYALVRLMMLLFWLLPVYAGLDFSEKNYPLSLEKRILPLFEFYKQSKQQMPELMKKYQDLKSALDS